MRIEDWQPTILGNEVNLITGFPFRSQAYTDNKSDIRLLRGDNIVQGHLRWDGVKRWPKSGDGEISRYHLEPGDVVLAMDRPWIEAGLKWAFVTEHDVPSLLVQRTARLRAKDNLDQTFLRYIIASSAFTTHVLSVQTGTAVPHISGKQIGEFSFLLPPLVEQRAIAHILGTLDDKIELNRRMNETLEEIARAIFKSWFVDFDPVRAKAESRDPGLPQPIADLFPDSLEDSELGEIPKGWRVGSLDSVLVLQRGFDLPATQRTSGAYPVLAASGPSGTHNEFMVRGPGVTTGRSGVLGKVFYVDDDFWPLNTSLWVKEFRHSRPVYAFHLLLGLDFALFNAGSAVPTLNRNHVHTLPTLLPPMGLIDAFERVATASVQRQKHNNHQSNTLAALRGTLLPRLISGELRVADAERAVEAVMV